MRNDPVVDEGGRRALSREDGTLVAVSLMAAAHAAFLT
jgi:hypothetical protein